MAASQQQIEPAQENPTLSAEVRRQRLLSEAVHERERQGLVLQRENILSQRTSHPARRTALEAALAHIEAELAALD